jgi:hypothetical protein
VLGRERERLLGEAEGRGPALLERRRAGRYFRRWGDAVSAVDCGIARSISRNLIRATLISCYADGTDMNLTITVDDEVLKRARIRALEQDTSVNAVLRDYLESYAEGPGRRREAVGRLVRLSKTTRARRGAAIWTRDELHER